MPPLPPNQAALRLLDAFLADPGTTTLEALLRWLLDASPRPTGNEVPLISLVQPTPS